MPGDLSHWSEDDLCYHHEHPDLVTHFVLQGTELRTCDIRGGIRMAAPSLRHPGEVPHAMGYHQRRVLQYLDFPQPGAGAIYSAELPDSFPGCAHQAAEYRRCFLIQAVPNHREGPLPIALRCAQRGELPLDVANLGRPSGSHLGCHKFAVRYPAERNG